MSRTAGQGMARPSSVYNNRRYFARKRGKLPPINYSENAEQALQAAGL